MLLFATFQAMQTAATTAGAGDSDVWLPTQAFVFLVVSNSTDIAYLNGLKLARELERFNLLNSDAGNTGHEALSTRLTVIDIGQADLVEERRSKCAFAHALVSIPDITRPPGSSAPPRTIFGPTTSTATGWLIDGMRLLCPGNETQRQLDCGSIDSPWDDEPLAEWNVDFYLGNSTYVLPLAPEGSQHPCVTSIPDHLRFFGGSNRDLARSLLDTAIASDSDSHEGVLKIATLHYEPRDSSAYGNSTYVGQLFEGLEAACAPCSEPSPRCSWRCIPRSITSEADHEALVPWLAKNRPTVIIPLTSQENVVPLLERLDRYAGETGERFTIVAPDTWTFLRTDPLYHDRPALADFCALDMIDLVAQRHEMTDRARRLLQRAPSERVHALIDPVRRIVAPDQYVLGFVFGYNDFADFRAQAATVADAAGRHRRHPATFRGCAWGSL